MRIKNWGEFQHFKDRTPPWIKLYRTLLDDPYWHELSGECAKTLTMLWLIASEDKNHEGCLPDIKTISFRLRLSESKLRQHLSELNHYVIIDDIKAISERYHIDTPETETETYSKETETDAKPILTKMIHSEIPKEWLDTCMKEKGYSENIVLDIWDGFREYWQNGKGKTVKRERWDATWRTWYRGQNIKGGSFQQKQKQTLSNVVTL